MGRICAFCEAPIPIESEQIYCNKCLDKMAMKMPYGKSWSQMSLQPRIL